MTNIEWTEKTWNPIVGCEVTSPGCKNCYAMKMAWRLGKIKATRRYAATVKKVNGKPVWTGVINAAPNNIWHAPLKRKKPTMYFVNSMGDMFHPNVPDAWIDRAFAIMALCPQHTFQILTKHSGRMNEYFEDGYARKVAINNAGFNLLLGPGGDGMKNPARRMINLEQTYLPLPNVWLGVSVENQKRAVERIPDLLNTLAAIRFISAEPLLGDLDIEPYINHIYLGHKATIPRLNWVIAGGESGAGARPSHPDWFRSLRDQCKAAGVPFFFKQWGEDTDILHIGPAWNKFTEKQRECESIDGTAMIRVGKKAAGRLLDGIEHNAMPEVK